MKYNLHIQFQTVFQPRIIIAFICIAQTFSTSAQYISNYVPDHYTDSLQVGDMKLGISSHSGGSINWVEVPEAGAGININAPGYGRAWQSAVRSKLHNGDYNPTQAGINQRWGTETTLTKTTSPNGAGGKVKITPFRCPLFIGATEYDFIENEDLTEDFFPSDGCDDSPCTGTDADGLDEGNLFMVDEIQSELDYGGFWEDVSGKVDNGISVLRHAFYYQYAREPAQIHQFAAVIPEDATQDKRPRISPTVYPDLLAGDQDIVIVLFSFGYRLTYSSKYHFLGWRNGNQWEWREVDPDRKFMRLWAYELESINLNTAFWNGAMGAGRGGASTLNEDYYPGDEFYMLSKGTDPDKSEAFAMYIPDNSLNRDKNVVGINSATNEQVYSEDRLLRQVFEIKRSGTGANLVYSDFEYPNNAGSYDWHFENDLAFITSRTFIRGLFQPSKGDTSTIERFQQEVYVLHGTPNEILEAVRQLKAEFVNDTVNYVNLFDEEIPVSSRIPGQGQDEFDAIRIYPNPAVENLFADYTRSKPCNLRLLDPCGRMIMSSPMNKGRNELDISGLQTGIYFVHYILDHKHIVKKIIKQ